MSYAPLQSDSNQLNGKRRSASASFTPTTARNAQPKRPPARPRRGATQGLGSGERPAGYPIIVHCHLCWDGVWQRPQQFLSRLSRRHPILFIETVGPAAHLAAPLAQYTTPAAWPNVTLLRLQFPAWRWGDGRHVDAERGRLVRDFLHGPLAGRFAGAVQWFYDPMAVTAFAGQLGESAIVYDCMDELAAFRGAPPALRAREAELLARADLVFTGGWSLYQAKRRFHDHCHFYGCGVDLDHFGQARDARTAPPPDLRALPRPVLGYFGVVDERMDYDLVARLAEANPEWSVVLIGPVTKVEAGSLPRRPNLHWLGARDYAALPACASGFDVCLMPFALNESTRFINPTKALEYMATGRPIVSSRVPDVVRNFGSVVKLAGTAAEFIAHCREAVAHPDEAAIQAGLAMAAANSWASIVAELERHVDEARARKAAARAGASAAVSQ